MTEPKNTANGCQSCGGNPKFRFRNSQPFILVPSPALLFGAH